jgi:hypothetical protein
MEQLMEKLMSKSLLGCVLFSFASSPAMATVEAAVR